MSAPKAPTCGTLVRRRDRKRHEIPTPVTPPPLWRAATTPGPAHAAYPFL